MNHTLNKSIAKIQRRHQVYQRRGAILAILAVITVLGVNWWLHQNGISMTADYQCGLEEHVHDDSCYTSTLTCELEETAALEGHTHSDLCYQQESVLVCTDESEEHTHDETCYETVETLICGLEETEAVEGHTHTEVCYERQLTCGMEEHTHTAACYGSDTSADRETASVWEATLPTEEELTGVWADDLIAVAKTQLGYTESTANFIVDENGEKKGYTRYGAWYGNEYGDWCAMFAAFCLNYAEVDRELVPINSGCQAWIVQLKDETIDLYRQADAYTPVPGDLIFFDWNGDGTSDHVGIVTQLVYETEGDDTTPVVAIKTIEGNTADKVAERKYDLTDKTILGYCQLPENPEEPEKEPAYPAFTYEETMEDGTVITIDAPEGAFPEGIQAALAVKDAAEYLEAIQTFSGREDVSDSAWYAYDFDFYTDEEHHNIEPLTDIKVTFSNLPNLAETVETLTGTEEETAAEPETAAETAAAEDAEETAETSAQVTVYHVSDGEEAGISSTTVTAADLAAGTVEIETNAFSTQIIEVAANNQNWGGPGGGSTATDSTTVDHIDIGISANASVTVNGKTSTATVTLEKSDFTSGNVTVTAKRSSGKSVTVNMNGTITTSTGTSGINQVRVNGTYSTGTLSDPAVYTFTLKKNVTFDIDGESVTLPVTLTSTFNYFSSDNDCPGIHNNENQQGKVSDASGFDFVMKFDIKLVTISKQVVDESGNPLNVSNYTVYFEVNNSSDTEAAKILLDKTSSGWAIEQVTSLDNLTIKEQTPPETVEIDGKKYTYLKTLYNGVESETGTPENGTIAVKNVYSTPQNIKILKYAGGEESRLLPGAQFILTNGKEGEELLYYMADGTTSTEQQILTTDENGEITVVGLPAGTYTLKEIQAPAGYNTLTEPITIVITSTNVTYGDQTVEKNDDGYYEIKVTNEPGFIIPETGGAGTTLYAAVGAGLMAAAALMYGLSLRRRRERRVE